jgi:hypothetical protein
MATAGDEDPASFTGMRFSYESICAYMGWTSLGEIWAAGVYKSGDVEKGDWLDRAEALGRSLS